MRLLVSLSLALLAVGVTPSCGLSFQHLIRTHGRDTRLTQHSETQSQVIHQDPKLPVNPQELAFYNNPNDGDIQEDKPVLVETGISVRDTSYKVGDAIVAKQVDRDTKKDISYQFTLGACLQRKKTWRKDNVNPFATTTYRQDSALTTVHDFFVDPMDAKFRVAGKDDENLPNPYATVVDRKWFPEGDWTRIQFKPHAECTCFGAKSGRTKWATMADFITAMEKLGMSRKINNAYFIGHVSGKVEFHFAGAVKKLELDPKNNNHPRGSVTSYQEHNGHRASYDQNAQQPVKKEEQHASIDMFDVKVRSAHGDSGAGLYIKQLDKSGNPLQGNLPDLFIGILSGATDSDDWTKFTPVWNMNWPNIYAIC